MLIKNKDVCQLLSISKTTLYRLRQRDSSFPKPVKFGSAQQGRIFYIEDDIKNWALNLNLTYAEYEAKK